MNPEDHPLAAGKLVRVASASNQAEAELIQGILQEDGVQSVLRRTPGFDVPEFLSAGPHDVLVAAESAEFARELLPQSSAGTEPSGAGAAPASRRVLAGVLIALALLSGVLCIAIQPWT